MGAFTTNITKPPRPLCGADPPGARAGGGYHLCLSPRPYPAVPVILVASILMAPKKSEKKHHKRYKDRWDYLTPQPEAPVGYSLKVVSWLEPTVSFVVHYLLTLFQFLSATFMALLYFIWRKTSFSWVFLQVGRVGFYLFFKNATAGGVTLWFVATGATPTILAFPLFFYFVLPRRFTKKYFGLSWGSGFLKTLVGFTGWLVYFFTSFSVVWRYFGFGRGFCKGG